MLNQESIKREGVKLIEEFSEKLAALPETEETHYVVDLKNISREDGKPVRKKDFAGKIGRLAPRFEDGYVVAEKGAGE